MTTPGPVALGTAPGRWVLPATVLALAMFGLTGGDYAEPAALSAGFPVAMGVCAVLMAVGSAAAWVTIRSDVLQTRR